MMGQNARVGERARSYPTIPTMAPFRPVRVRAAKDLVPGQVVLAHDHQRARVREVTAGLEVVTVTAEWVGFGGVYRFSAAPEDGWRTVDAGRRGGAGWPR
jgi:hypothetical protein